MNEPVPLRWVPRTDPLTPTAVAAAPRDMRWLLAAIGRKLSEGVALRLACGSGGAIALGPASDLPWFPGALYLGRVEGAEPGVLEPTAIAPVPAADLAIAAARHRLPAGCDLIALVPWGIMVATTPARPVDAAALEAAHCERRAEWPPAAAR